MTAFMLSSQTHDRHIAVLDLQHHTQTDMHLDSARIPAWSSSQVRYAACNDKQDQST